MKSELTSELTDLIIYGMENQQEYFYLNIETGVVEPESQLSETADISESRYEKIPRWSPADGFLLMEKFVDSLRNPVFRERLKSALSAGKGVFRNFKNILKEREDIQRLWFNFKEKEMRARVVEWFELVCEARGLAMLGGEPEETEDLVLSDFRIEPAPPELASMLESYDLKSFTEAFGDAPREFTHLLYLARRSLITRDTEEVIVLRAVSPAGETAGLVWGVDSWLGDETRRFFSHDPGVSFLLQFYVEPEYRGLGLSRMLLNSYIDGAYSREMKRVVVDLWGGGRSLDKLLSEFGFGGYRESYMLDLSRWKE